MDKSVIIKSNKNGIVLILEDNIPFDDLLVKISDKFKEAKKFFGKCEMVLTISGRTLSNAEVKAVVDIIQTESEIEIILVSDESEINNALFTKALKKLKVRLDLAACEIVKGNLKSGKTASFKNSVLIIGNVEDHAEVHSEGSIFILGSLNGSAFAGELGNINAKVFAADMCPDTVMIYDNYFKMPKLVEEREIKSLFSKKVEEIEVKKSLLVYVKNDKVEYEILN